MERTVIIGGKAGEGVKESANLLSKVLVGMGFYVFTYHDYPSLIRGGHNFSTVRFSDRKVKSPTRYADVIVALDERSLKKHTNDAREGTLWILDASVNGSGERVDIKGKVKGVMTSSAVLGILLKTFGIPVERGIEAIKGLKNFDENRKLLEEFYSQAREIERVEPVGERKGEYISGNEAVAIGAVDGGLEVFIAYPMTPASPVLHYLAAHKDELGIKVIHPENEIGVINMVVGAAFAGRRAMTGTSGGGFALMTETLSMAGMSETPVVIYEAQRGAPSTGVPTYTEQSDLLFVLYAGHGDFQRIVVAPGTAGECYELTREALNLAWRFQVPVLILGDKHVGESFFTESIERKRIVEEPKLWRGGNYRRYAFTDDGISPLAFPGTKGIVVKGTSYEHDEYGLTVEDADKVRKMKDKRALKQKTINEFFNSRNDTVKVEGDGSSKRVIITWGENAGVCDEVGKALGFKVLRPLYLEPFPARRIKEELVGAESVTVVELSVAGQFEKLLRTYGIEADSRIRKYDARPLFREELEKLLREV